MSDLFHSALCPQDPSMLPEMAEFPSFTMAELCVYMHIKISLSIYLSQWTLRLFPYFLSLGMKIPSSKLKHVKMWNRV